jgi:hypothetical protein
MVTDRVAIDATILFETADELPSIVANPLQKDSGGLQRGRTQGGSAGDGGQS